MMDDKAVIELVKETANFVRNNDSQRITAIETVLPGIKDDIKELKIQRKDEPKEIEARKNKKTDFLFKIISVVISIIALLLSFYNMFFKK